MIPAPQTCSSWIEPPSAPRPRCGPRGFTLLELLAVVAIIVVLIALLAPAMDRALEQANRTRCAANMDAITTAATAYALANQQGLFICRGRNVTICFNRKGAGHSASEPDRQTDWPAALASVGLAETSKTAQRSGVTENTPSKVWDCPSRGYESHWDGDYTSEQMIISYRYFGGVVTWYNPDGAIPARSPTRVNQSRGSWLLIADHTAKVNGVWGSALGNSSETSGSGYGAYAKGTPAHRRDGRLPDGHNQGYLDGSAEFVEAERLFYMTEWHANRNEPTYSWQADLGKWQPTDPLYLRNDEDFGG